LLRLKIAIGVPAISRRVNGKLKRLERPWIQANSNLQPFAPGAGPQHPLSRFVRREKMRAAISFPGSAQRRCLERPHPQFLSTLK
jgi:hypothetical protein